MARPRILLVPLLCEIEWRIQPMLEEWAEVASYDAPGVGDQPPAPEPGIAALRERGLAVVDERRWERYLVVGDEHGAFPAVEIAASRPESVAGLALGHACLAYRGHGDRPPIRAEVMAAFNKLAEFDYRTYARALTQITQDAYDDATAEEYIRRVSQQTTLAYTTKVFEELGELDVEARLRELDRPLLFARHEECLAWTDEGFEDAVAAFPEAITTSSVEKPSVSAAFAAALREFCRDLDWD